MDRKVAFCKAVNTVFSLHLLGRVIKPPNLGRRRTPDEYPEWEFSYAIRPLSFFTPYNRIEGKKILDIGCGHGGKSVYFALNGATSVEGIDINPDKIGIAEKFARRMQANNINFHIGDASCLPYKSQLFDMVLFNDSFEHLDNPEKILLECQRVLKKGGVINIAFPPYGSPWGAHLFAHIRIPWAQFFFAEKTLLKIWKDYEAINNIGTITYSKERIQAIAKAKTIAELTHLNKMTIERFEQIIAKTRLKLSLWHFKTVGNLFGCFVNQNRVREYIVSRVVAVLKK